jgi:steroid delta-isomerase-like uncharacterized protein
MIEQDNLKLARESIEAFNTKNWERFKACMQPEGVYDEKATQRRVQGADQAVQLSRAWTQTFPDAKGKVLNAVASGDTVVLELTWEGTQNGPLAAPTGDLPASGKRVTIPAVQVLTMQGGKIKETHHYFDFMSMLQQLDMAPVAASARR